uniref:Nucleolar protein 4-like a n=1 Tax=Cynoglossus semilaevis TaxID=244447 RepID=A0A3P8X416_CYNSE
MHVEMGADPGRAPKHAGQKKTYKAIAETYAFLPREAVTRFLMSCGECQKRMHINPSTAEFKENDRPTSLAPDLIDYNMPLTATYLKQMKLQCMNTNERVSACCTRGQWVSSQQGSQGSTESNDDSSVSSSANGLPALTSPEVLTVAGNHPDGGLPYVEVVENGVSAPLDFSTTSSSPSSDDQQPVNLSDRLTGGSLSNTYAAEPNRKYPVKTEYTNKSPPYSSGSYNSVKTDVSMSVEDLSSGRAQIIDDDDDEHDDHDDSDKINDAEGMDPERLKAFNMFVRLFVDENLDRMVPISKQPKEKIQAIIESCTRQFPEFQERSRKRIRTYLKSCRRMKKGGFEIRPTPPHLTSAMAENILASACESETRNAAKRMRLDTYQATDEPPSADKSNLRDPAPAAPTAFSISSAAFAQDQAYTNGGLNYNLRGYGSVNSSNQQHSGATQTNGPTDLSMKSVGPNSSSSSNSHGQGGGSGGASAQLSPPEVTAVRQLIAGYRESAAFLLRSADELENLILQQN